MSRHALSFRAAWLLLAGLAFAACGGMTHGPQVGSETHFLKACGSGCGPGAECICGACSQVCAGDEECAELALSATCVALSPRVAEGRCETSAPAAMCDASCLLASDCAALGAGYRCDAGYCRAGDAPDGVGPAMCSVAPLAGSDVMVLGDSVLELSPFAADLSSAASAAGVLAEGEQLRNYAAAATSWLADNNLSINAQYDAAMSDGPARVVIMNGGATDLLSTPCGTTPAPDCPQLLAAVAGAELLFSKLAQNGVEHVVYAFYPDPLANPPLQAGIDAVRPLVENACGRSGVACHFLDLRPSFDGHLDYLAATPSAGVNWSDAGAEVAAEAVLGVLVDRCIAVAR